MDSAETPPPGSDAAIAAGCRTRAGAYGRMTVARQCAHLVHSTAALSAPVITSVMLSSVG